MTIKTPSKDDIDQFFESPELSEGKAGIAVKNKLKPNLQCRRFSSLYHLRKNAAFCFLIDNENNFFAPWLGTMCVMSGIDLIACLHAGTNSKRKAPKGIKLPDSWKDSVGERFKRFLTHVVKMDKDDAKVIYAFRNALMHSFGVVSNSNKFVAVAEERGAPLLKSLPGGRFQINLFKLYRKFESVMIRSYEKRLKKPKSRLRKPFAVMYPEIGTILVSARSRTAKKSTKTKSSSKNVFDRIHFENKGILTGWTELNLLASCRAASGG